MQIKFIIIKLHKCIYLIIAEYIQSKNMDNILMLWRYLLIIFDNIS